MRDAFDSMVDDPEYIETANKQLFDINPVSGENLQKTVADIIVTPKPIGDRLLKILGSPN